MKALPWTNTSQLSSASGTLSSSEFESDDARLVLHLFDQLQPRMVRYALSFGIPAEDAEDIVQEAFLSLFRHLESGHPRANLNGWLFRVVHNLALKRRTANQSLGRGVVHSADLDCHASPGDDAYASFAFSQEHQKLQAVFQVLPKIEQRCLSLRAEGFKYREISRILGISLGSVSSSMARSLARMVRATGKE